MDRIIVIGGGLMGCAAAWQLARAGKKVLLLEKQDEAYNQGSSYGEARVTRSLGVENDLFTYLKECSVLETKTLVELLNQWDDEKHAISDIHTDSPVTYLYDQSLLSDVDQLIRDDSYQTAINSEQQQDLFGVNFPEKIVIREFKTHSGTLNPKELIRKLKRGIRLCGGEIKHNTLVDSILRSNEGITIDCKNVKTSLAESITASQIVVCAGPYTADVLHGITSIFDNLLIRKRLYLCFYQLEKEYWASLSASDQDRFKSFFPIANFNEDVYYSMIEKMNHGAPLIKVGGHMRRFEINDGQDIWKDHIPDTEVDWAKQETLNYLDGIGFSINADQLNYVNGYACVYTLTQSEVPIVGPAITENGEFLNDVVVVAGLSGIGAKGTMAYGRHAADYILGNDVHDPMYQMAKKQMAISSPA